MHDSKLVIEETKEEHDCSSDSSEHSCGRTPKLNLKLIDVNKLKDLNNNDSNSESLDIVSKDSSLFFNKSGEN